MHDEIAVTCCCTHVQWCLDCVLSSVELIIDWIVVPCSVSIVLGRHGWHLSLGLLVTTSQEATKVGFHEGSVAQISVYYVRSKLPWRMRLLGFGVVRPWGRIHSSILEAGGVVLRSEWDQGGQVGSSIPECHRTGELLTFTEYLIATEPRGAAPKEAHGCLERVLWFQEDGHGSEVSFSPASAAAWGVHGHIFGRLRKLAVPCESGESLDEALRDWLDNGLCDKAYQKCLLSEHKLTLDKALQIAQSMETADVNALTLRDSESRIHQISKGSCLTPPGKSQTGQQTKAPG